jgi:hypothetical protein
LRQFHPGAQRHLHEVQHLRLNQRLFMTGTATFWALHTHDVAAMPIRFAAHGAKSPLCRSLGMPYLQSAAIETVAYDESTQLLRAKFRGDGKVMVYENVPQDVYDSLIFADLNSSFFHDHIENAYPAREAPGTVGAKRQ